MWHTVEADIGNTRVYNKKAVRESGGIVLAVVTARLLSEEAAAARSESMVA